MRLRKIKNAKEKLTEFAGLVLFDPNQYKDKWQEEFKNNNPIHLEIGMGKGQFIARQAELNPKINFIGLEIEDSIILRAARKISTQSLSNLRLINYNALNLNELFKEKSVSKIYLNFSDPWPKTRHEKRRFTSDDFLNLYKKVLVEDGIIEMKTDNRKLFEYSILKFNEHGFKFLDLNLNLHEVENPEIITTEYEDKFKNLNQTIYYVQVKI